MKRSMRWARPTALAIILFLTVFGAANIYIKALNKVRQR